MKTKEVLRKGKPYYQIEHKGKTSTLKKYAEVPLSAYKEKVKSGSRKSVLNFVKGKKPLLIRLDTKGGSIIKATKGGKTISVKISPLMEEGFRRAITESLEGKLPKRKIKEAATIYSSENNEAGLAKLSKLMGRYRSLGELLAQMPQPSTGIEVKNWATMNRQGIYTEIAGSIKKEDLAEEMLKIGTRIDQRLYYHIEILDTNGNTIGTVQLRGSRPEGTAMWLQTVKNMADQGLIQSPPKDSLFGLGTGVETKHRVGKPNIPQAGHLNRNISGFRVKILFKTKG